MAFPDFLQSPSAISTAGLTSNQWNTLSSGAPPGASGMTIRLVGGSGSGAREFRKTGSSDTYTTDSTPSTQQLDRWVGLKAGQNGVNDFDFYSLTASTDVITPLVYWGPEVTFPTNQIIMPSTLTTSMATYSTGGNAPSALAGVFRIRGAGDFDSYFRHPSSTDTFQNGNENASCGRDFFCALNGTQQYAAVAGTAGRQPYLVAYFTSNVVIPTNGIAVTRTPGTAGSYQNLATTGDTSPVGIIYYMHSNTSYAFQLSGQGTSWSAPNTVYAGAYAGPSIAYAPAQANIANLALAVSELAYFIGSSPSIAWVT